MNTLPDANGYYYQSVEKYKQRAYETSLELITKAIALDATQISYYYQRGVVLQRLQSFAAALQDYDQVIDRADLGKPGQSYRKALMTKAVLGKIEIHYQQKRYHLLASNCSYLLQHQRNNWNAFFYRGMGHYFSHNYALAYEDIEMAFYLSNDPDKIRTYRALICFKLEKFAQAQYDFEIALRHKPHEVVLWYNQGINLYKLHRFAESVVSFDRAIELGMKTKQLYIYKGEALTVLGRENEARQCWTEAKQLK